MGFEVIFHFHPQKDGEYDKSVKERGSIKVGDPYEEVPLDVLAGKVMALMARRNIFVTGVEIFEVAKKQISFREHDDCIVIKNKKFKFDDGPSLAGEQVAEAVPPTVTPNQPAVTGLAVRPVSARPASPPPTGTLRHEFYSPEDPVWVEVARRSNPQMKFTEGKRYPILSEKIEPMSGLPGGAGLIYTTVDDNGRKVRVPEKLFLLKMPQLDETGMINHSQGLSDRGLSWAGTTDAYGDVPDLRRK